MTTQTVRIPDGFRLDSNAYTDTRHYTYISTPLHDTSRGWLALHHGVQIETRDSAPIVAPDPVTAPDAMMSLTAIEHLDFEPERECEHPQHPLGEMGHSGPAWALVEVIHLCASPSRTLVYVCRGGWDEAGARGTHCQRCGENLTRDQSWRIVQVLR